MDEYFTLLLQHLAANDTVQVDVLMEDCSPFTATPVGIKLLLCYVQPPRMVIRISHLLACSTAAVGSYTACPGVGHTNQQRDST